MLWTKGKAASLSPRPFAFFPFYFFPSLLPGSLFPTHLPKPSLSPHLFSGTFSDSGPNPDPFDFWLPRVFSRVYVQQHHSFSLASMAQGSVSMKVPLPYSRAQATHLSFLSFLPVGSLPFFIHIFKKPPAPILAVVGRCVSFLGLLEQSSTDWRFKRQKGVSSWFWRPEV